MNDKILLKLINMFLKECQNKYNFGKYPKINLKQFPETCHKSPAFLIAYNNFFKSNNLNANEKLILSFAWNRFISFIIRPIVYRQIIDFFQNKSLVLDEIHSNLDKKYNHMCHNTSDALDFLFRKRWNIFDCYRIIDYSIDISTSKRSYRFWFEINSSLLQLLNENIDLSNIKIDFNQIKKQMKYILINYGTNELYFN
jgi:hypothetical protein